MDQARSSSGNNNIGEDNVGIPDDLRCKRSDGKQWRCTAMSMPDKTVCEKHYIQAKKRAANSAMRANLKKAKRKSGVGAIEDSDGAKSDDFDLPLSSAIKHGEHSSGGSKFLDKVSKNQFRYAPEGKRGASAAGAVPPRPSDDDSEEEEEEALYEENWTGYDSPEEPADSSRKRRSLDATNATTEYSDESSDTSEDTGGHICHQCRRNNRDRVVTWCQRCGRRGYCDICISTW